MGDSTTNPRLIEKVAKIESTHIGYESHRILTIYLHLDFGGSGQSAGGYGRFDLWGAEFIRRTIDACGVESWEKLRGKTILALLPHDGYGAQIVGIRNLPTEKGGTFIFEDLMREVRAKEEATDA